MDQRDDFKVSLKRSGLGEEEHFINFKSTRSTCVDDISIFRLIDAVNLYIPEQMPKEQITNWIRTFDDGGEILEYIDIFINNKLNVMFPIDKNIVEIPHLLSRYSEGIPKNSSDLNHEIISILNHVSGLNIISQSSARIDFLRHRDLRIDTVTLEESRTIENLEIFRGNRPSFIAVDTSWEIIDVGTWKNNIYFQRILEASRKLAKKESLSFSKYIRIVVLSDAQSIISNPKFMEFSSEFINFHIENNIKLGFINYQKIKNFPVREDLRLLNFYLIPNLKLTLWDPKTGYTIDCARNTVVRDLIRHHTDFCMEMTKVIDLEENGFWVTKPISPQVLAEKMIGISS